MTRKERRLVILKHLKKGPMRSSWISEILHLQSSERARLLLKRMERDGLVSSATFDRSGVLWWTLTDKGRSVAGI